MSSLRPEHQIFWIKPGGQLAFWGLRAASSIGTQAKTNTVSALAKKYPRFELYLRLWAGHPRGTAAAFMRRLPLADPALDRRAIDRAVIELVTLGAGQSLRFLQTNWNAIRSSLTPQYQELIRGVDFSIPARNELIFHCTEPDLYLYRSVQSTHLERSLLVCFCTKKNTLNAPLPIAHIALQRRVSDILYVRNRNGANPADGLGGLNFEETASMLNQLIRKQLGYQKVFGLGTSVGGYAACIYAAPLGFEGVLNFSGAPGLEAQNELNRQPLGLRVKDYPLKKILSVLSARDPTDQKILQRYRESGFDTKLTLVDSATHGSFTAALLEGKLGGIVGWLGLVPTG